MMALEAMEYFLGEVPKKEKKKEKVPSDTEGAGSAGRLGRP